MFGYEEVIERLKKRVEVNDTKAMSILGCHYRDGMHGLPQDRNSNKSLELSWHGIGQGSLVVPMLIGNVTE